MSEASEPAPDPQLARNETQNSLPFVSCACAATLPAPRSRQKKKNSVRLGISCTPNSSTISGAKATMSGQANQRAAIASWASGVQRLTTPIASRTTQATLGASARDNLRYGNWNATEDDIWQAARDAHAEEFLRALPEGARKRYFRESGDGLSLVDGAGHRHGYGDAVLVQVDSADVESGQLELRLVRRKK